MSNQNLQILSGKLRGRSLKSPHHQATHPMGSREKLALFNMLRPFLNGATVLDAYAGSGALGIEAASCGATKLTFVEANSQVAQVLKSNLQTVQLQSISTVYRQTVEKFIATSPKERFDIIIADPPYDHFVLAEIQALSTLLKPGGILALSFPARLQSPELTQLSLLSLHHYAASGIALYQSPAI